jgi:hypothetical protein
VPAVNLEMALGQENVQRLSGDFLMSVPEDSFGALVEQDDVLPFINGNNRVIGEIENFGERVRRRQKSPIHMMLRWASMSLLSSRRNNFTRHPRPPTVARQFPERSIGTSGQNSFPTVPRRIRPDRRPGALEYFGIPLVYRIAMVEIRSVGG